MIDRHRLAAIHNGDGAVRRQAHGQDTQIQPGHFPGQIIEPLVCYYT